MTTMILVVASCGRPPGPMLHRLPEFAGGDREKSRELLDRAQAVGPESLLVRWGRAKYFHLETRNRAGFESDLRWVVAQDPRRASSPYAWNVYFQTQAREAYDRVEALAEQAAAGSAGLQAAVRRRAAQARKRLRRLHRRLRPEVRGSLVPDRVGFETALRGMTTNPVFVTKD